MERAFWMPTRALSRQGWLRLVSSTALRISCVTAFACWELLQTLRLTGGLYGTKIHSFDPPLTAGLHRICDPTIPSVLSSTNRVGQRSTRWQSPSGSADRLRVRAASARCRKSASLRCIGTAACTATRRGRCFSRRSAGEVDDGPRHGQLVLAGFRGRQTALAEKVAGKVVVCVGQLLGGDLALILERVDHVWDA
jgi:hypothetical protein